MNKIWLRTIALITVLVATSASAGIFDGKFTREVKVEQAAISLHNDTIAGDYKLIDTITLHSKITNNADMIVVDTMPFAASYKKEHVPSAVGFEFPIKTMNKWDKNLTAGKSIDDFKKLLGPDKNKLIVIYCGFVKCRRSHNGALWARKLGYTNVSRYPGGIFAWKGAEYKTESVN